MNLDVSFTPGEVVTGELGARVAVVIDVLRATSTMVEALGNGARAVFPVGSIEDAVRLAQNLDREQVVLCGERRSLRIEGFDLGNSPREFTPEQVGGKLLVMTTTNGTPALVAAIGARRVLIASFLNLGAVIEELAADGGPAAIICAGRERRFALEDAACAGALVRGLRARSQAPLELNDAALAAEILAAEPRRPLAERLRETAAGRQLIEAGLGEDVDFCARQDRHRSVPELRDRQITL